MCTISGPKFGLYVTPGISQQAVAQNTADPGHLLHRRRDREPASRRTTTTAAAWSGIDYSKPGAQAFIDSWADEFASWGVDYVKLDGVGTSTSRTCRRGRRRCGRPAGRSTWSCPTACASPTPRTWAQYSNGWRTGGDIECYCERAAPATR